MKLHYSAHIPEKDIVGRVLGPDMHGGWGHVIRATYPEPDRTVVDVLPLPPDQMAHMTRDMFHQWWLPLPEKFDITEEK